MENVYFIQLVSDPNRFEEVPQRIFDERTNAKIDYTTDTPRYTENWFGRVNGHVVMHIECSYNVAGIVMRLLSVKEPSMVAGGWATKPEVVHMQRGRRRIGIDLKNDCELVKLTPKKVKPTIAIQKAA